MPKVAPSFLTFSYKVTFTPRSTDPHDVDLRVSGYQVRPGMSMVINVLDSFPFGDPPDGYADPSGIAVDIDRYC